MGCPVQFEDCIVASATTCLLRNKRSNEMKIMTFTIAKIIVAEMSDSKPIRAICKNHPTFAQAQHH
jgi:hypothetical protein